MFGPYLSLSWTFSQRESSGSRAPSELKGASFSLSPHSERLKTKPLSNAMIQRLMWHPRFEILQVDLCPSENFKLHWSCNMVSASNSGGFVFKEKLLLLKQEPMWEMYSPQIFFFPPLPSTPAVKVPLCKTLYSKLLHWSCSRTISEVLRMDCVAGGFNCRCISSTV